VAWKWGILVAMTHLPVQLRGLVLLACFAVLVHGWAAGDGSAQPDFKSSHLAVGLAPTAPAFSFFAVDSLGRGESLENTGLNSKLSGGSNRLEWLGENQFRYVEQFGGKTIETWRGSFSETRITLRSEYVPDLSVSSFLLLIDQKKNHATLLGNLVPDKLKVAAPCVLHLPDHGTFRISANQKSAALDYDARRRQPENFVRVAFPPATKEQGMVEYSLEVTLIHPDLPGLADNPLYDGYRRNFLNLIQLHPRLRTLANNSSSDVCGFCLWQYAELGVKAPPLADGLTVNDLVRMSVDRVLDGGITYGQAGYRGTPMFPEAAAWSPKFDSLDTLPSFLIAGCSYVKGSGDRQWAAQRFPKLLELGRAMLAHDRNGNGLIEYQRPGNSGSWKEGDRPANWWDTIGFGHEDAYANALAYRACVLMAELARTSGRPAEAEEFSNAARKLRAAYVPTLLNPKTGVLAGWKSADGELHDYWFTFINGMAISFGLVDEAQANAIMDRLLKKMDEVGYRRFELGLPGNLIPVRRADYTDLRRRYGGPSEEDGSDAFQIYENGGATHCHAYWTVKALYQLGRVEDARKIFHPMLRSFATGDFQGFDAKGQSKDWRTWDGECRGYEGYLSDGYLALLAVEDDVKAGMKAKLTGNESGEEAAAR
jgi:hypothetical protein